MKYRHWFWDFDGTLFNTYPRICRALQKSLADAGIFEDVDVIMPVLKVTLETAAKHFAEPHGIDAQKILEGYHLHSEEEDMSTMRAYPGMHDFLVAVKSLGGANYLYTHRGESVFKALKSENLEALFSDMVTGLDGFPPKPAPDALKYLIVKHHLNPSECVMVGDRVIDLRAGLNSNMNAICLDPDGFCPPLENVPVFHDYSSLRTWIDEN